MNVTDERNITMATIDDFRRTTPGLAALVVGALVSLASPPVQADYQLARRTPTGRQLFHSVKIEADRAKHITTIIDTLVGKYYTEEGSGLLVGVPLLYRTTPQGSTYGISDATLTLKHVVTFAPEFSIAPYARAQFPTGAFSAAQKVNVGTGRFNEAFGAWYTLTWKKFEGDAMTEYVFQLPNPHTAVDPGDVVQGSVSAAYHSGGFWTGIEISGRRSWSDRKLDKIVAVGQESFAAGPEMRVNLGAGVLVHASAKTATNNTLSGEMRILYNF